MNSKTKTSILLILAFVFSTYALVYTPRISIKGQDDYHSLESILSTVISDQMTNAQKAEAVWRFVLSATFHYKAPEEGLIDNSLKFEMNTLEDPVKLLNSYGYAYCFSNVSILTKLWEVAGFDSTRTWGIGGHMIAEVFYDGAWHHYDSDQSVSAYFIKHDGKTVASVSDIIESPNFYIIDPKYRSIPQMPYDKNPIYSHESRAVLASYYASKNDNYIRDRIGILTHRMDYYLRKNEELTLYFHPTGKWRHTGMDVSVINPALGPYDAHGTRTYGNGVFVYKPDLSSIAAVEDGLHSYNNVVINKGIRPADPSKISKTVIKVLSPWVITGRPLSPSASVDKYVDYCDAAVVSGFLKKTEDKSAKNGPLLFSIQIKTEKQPEWQHVYSQQREGYFTVDLSKWFSEANYYYELSFIFGKDSGNGSIEELQITTSVQVNPASLPQLKPGNNELIYSMDGPAVDKISVENGAIIGQCVEKYIHSTENITVTNEQVRRFVQTDNKKPATIILKQLMEEGTVIDYWYEMLFHQRKSSTVTIEKAENKTEEWGLIEKKDKVHHDHWAEWHSKIFKPSTGNAKTVYYRVTLSGGSALVLFNGGYRYAYKPPEGSISVEQTAIIDGKEKVFKWNFKERNGKKEILIDGKSVINKSIRFVCGKQP